MTIRKKYKTLIDKYQGKRPFGIHKHRWNELKLVFGYKNLIIGYRGVLMGCLLTL
jgi:hypothetical protein